jgi:hypothetical protein
MICPCSFEELRALTAGAEGLLVTRGAPQALVRDLLDQLDGDLELPSGEEQARTLSGVTAVVQHLREDMDRAILDTHPAAEETVDAYFNYAHALTVQHRLALLDGERRALEALMKGEDVSLHP